MSTVGIIVEYNPLHNGHVHHYSRAKEMTGAQHTIAVLSGPFLQRGEPALVNKYARTDMALAMGVDLVIELPTVYAVQPAEWFAFGAVALLEATGVVDSLCFGTETGTLELLLPLSHKLATESESMKKELSKLLNQGMSYPAAYSTAIGNLSNDPIDKEDIVSLLQQPNHNLGLHYLIALQRLKSNIVPCTIPRESAGYHDSTPSKSNIASATAIRRLVLEQDFQAAAPYVPSYTLEIMRKEFDAGRGPIGWESFRQPLMHQLLTQSTSELAQFHEVTEGLEYRIKKLLPHVVNLNVSDLLHSLKTKRYTHTKLQRMLAHILLHHTKQEMSPISLGEGPQYLRVLGFSPSGQKLLKQMKKTASLPIVVKPSNHSHTHLERDLQASAVYANAYRHLNNREMFRDYFEPPIKA
ncbi:nucleotidyltransferase [Paenibacillus sp. IHBB 10380]|uniref:nucleotidyltransferase n=1 Tax=Paenibacillus sp. IHBB 10380 TaxID=1566358 RepID=UPI0005CFC417|nr:nucleotidyltransferase [Paenibacillus sp. IHBB 10380]AJS59274.1 nucleotidyltransferase [Paenibacillus sp. IHBB 10380]